MVSNILAKTCYDAKRQTLVRVQRHWDKQYSLFFGTLFQWVSYCGISDCPRVFPKVFQKVWGWLIMKSSGSEVLFPKKNHIPLEFFPDYSKRQ